MVDDREHPRCRVPVTDDESGDDLWAGEAEASARRELRTVRLVSASALLLAVLSAIATASIVLRSSKDAQSVGQSTPLSTHSTDVLGLHVKRLQRGWHRTYLDSQVFATASLDSPVVQMLPVNSLVYVAEAHQQLVRLTKPVRGWMRTWTDEGVEVLAPDETYRANPDELDMEEISRSRQARETNERQQLRSMRMAALQQETVDALKRLEAGKTMRRQVPHVAKQVKQAHKTGERLAKQAVKALRGKGGMDAVTWTTHEQGKHILRAVSNSQLGGMVGGLPRDF